jgi:hypothetical protein
VAPIPERSRIGPRPGLVDEDQPLCFDATLILCPLSAPPRHVATIALAGHHAFFEAELLGVQEVPHRVVIDLQAASGKLGNEPAYGEIAALDPLRQPDRVLPGNRLRPPIWPGATLPVSSSRFIQFDCRADRHPKRSCSP